MDIHHRDDGKKGSFYIAGKDKILAEMTYVWTGKARIIIDHTVVEDELKGQGAGKQLVEKAVDFARSNSVRILPLCPFAKSVLLKEKAYRDVL